MDNDSLDVRIQKRKDEKDAQVPLSLFWVDFCLADYSKVDIPDSRYRSVNVGAGKSLGSSIKCARID